MTLVIPRAATRTLGQISGRERLTYEINAQGLEDVREMLRNITTRETEEQLSIDNPPSLLEIDNRTGKLLADVQRRVVVIFGVRLARTAMRLVEQELFKAIDRTTIRRTGTLSEKSNWEWRYVSNGRVQSIVDPSEIKSFGPGDRLVLMPARVPWATVVNARVSQSGQLSIAGRASKKNPTARPSKANQNLGFLAYAARMLKRKTEFKQFAIFVAFTKSFAIPGELSRMQGTGMLVIKPRSRLERNRPQ